MNEKQVLTERLGASPVPSPVVVNLRRHRGDELSQFRIEHAPSATQVFVQGMGVLLGQHVDLTQSRVKAVAQDEIDDAVRTSEGHGRLRTIPRQGTERRAAISGKDNGKCV